MKAETKFNVDDEVWTLIKNKAKLCPITKIEIIISANNCRAMYYLNIGTNEKYECEIVNESFIFKTKEDLIESIIN